LARGKKPDARLLLECLLTLEGKSARRAYTAMQHLTAWPEESVALLEKHLKPAVKVSPKRVKELIGEATAEKLEGGARARAALLELDDQALPVLREYTGTSSPPSLVVALTPVLRRVEAGILKRARAVEALELIGTPAARRLLANLAKGAPEALLTREARVSLDRLRKRGPGR
jgi:hypothetical protein